MNRPPAVRPWALLRSTGFLLAAACLLYGARGPARWLSTTSQTTDKDNCLSHPTWTYDQRVPARLCSCGTLVRDGGGRCTDCQARRRGVLARRGTTVGRGYGQEHTALRAQWKPEVDAGQIECHADVCINPHGRLIEPGTPWQLGHTPDRATWTGPEHRACGSSDGARRRHARDALTR